MQARGRRDWHSLAPFRSIGSPIGQIVAAGSDILVAAGNHLLVLSANEASEQGSESLTRCEADCQRHL